MKKEPFKKNQVVYVVVREYDHTYHCLEAKYVGDMFSREQFVVELPNNEIMMVDMGDVYEKLEDCLNTCMKSNQNYAQHYQRELKEQIELNQRLEGKILKLEDWAKKRMYKPYNK